MFKKIAQKLKTQYYLFWVLPILFVVAYETDFLPVGLYADDPRMMYIWETVGILTAIVCVPLALKLFSVVLKKKIDEVHLTEALSKYILWSGVRLAILEVAILLNILVYYLTLSNVGAFCALIAVTASVFCLPGEKRMREELNVNTEE
ncbi:hypothetical protein [Bacteroides sp. 51]|uniref:hypothetical protein n=1 Tax=Bacteroides sp. 51 TaxID=2302938 RepID=UPI0013D1F662|nr:hypothetical protein [Bacteroides sp. 51]NDV82885.1 hypothetical protein [Bacteroides sp. 51]